MFAEIEPFIWSNRAYPNRSAAAKDALNIVPGKQAYIHAMAYTQIIYIHVPLCSTNMHGVLPDL